MTKEIEGVPAGWEAVAYRKAKAGEYSISEGRPYMWPNHSIQVHLIIRKKFAIEEGKYYKRRDGVVVGPTYIFSAGSKYPWSASSHGGDQWNDDGKRCLQGLEHTDLIEEVPKPEPKYRPFKNAEEFKPHRDKWILKNEGDGTGCWKAFSYSSEGVCTSSSRRTSYAELLNWKFEDGTPCGVKVQ